MAYCYRCGKIFHEESLENDNYSKIICAITFCKNCIEECDMTIKENQNGRISKEENAGS